MNNLLSKIESNMDNFFSCTNLNIGAYRKDGSLLSSLGELPKIDFNMIFNLFDNKNNIVNLTLYENIYLTVCPILKGDYDYGFYLIGPYSNEKNNIRNIIYKPIHCIPHLIDILYADLDIKEENHNFYITKAMKFMKDNYNEEISLDTIANELNINKTYFCNIFKKTKGKTFTHALNDIRIEQAKNMLLTTNKSIADIALSSGFASQNYFNKVFKIKEGITPLEFRNTN